MEKREIGVASGVKRTERKRLCDDPNNLMESFRATRRNANAIILSVVRFLLLISFRINDDAAIVCFTRDLFTRPERRGIEREKLLQSHSVLTTFELRYLSV